jgi:hypothetical protein
VSDNHYLIATANIVTFFDLQKEFDKNYSCFLK